MQRARKRQSKSTVPHGRAVCKTQQGSKLNHYPMPVWVVLLHSLYYTADMDEWELGYIAGLIDGEAHVGIQREIGRNRHTPQYSIRFEIAMTNIEPIDLVNRVLPKAKVIHVQAKGRRLPYYRLRLIHKDALDLLTAVLPYLQGKKREVELCLALDALRKKHSPSRIHVGLAHFQPMPDDFVQEAERIYWKLRSLHLNKKPRFMQAVERLI